MNKILNLPNYVIAIILLLIATLMIYDFMTIDTSNVQSAQAIEIAIKPCEVVDSKQIEVKFFKKNDPSFVCGEILSEYLPLDLRYFLIDRKSGEEIFSEYRKINAYQFSIKLPDGLDVGEYEFKIKAGRYHIVSLYFEIVPVLPP